MRYLDSEYYFVAPSGIAEKFSLHVIFLESRDMATKMFYPLSLFLFTIFEILLWGRDIWETILLGYPIFPEPLELRGPYWHEHLGLMV